MAEQGPERGECRVTVGRVGSEFSARSVWVAQIQPCEAEIPHAFGGAIALAYYATPRGTRDVDINLFVSVKEFGRVLAALPPLGVDAPTREMQHALERDEPVRMHWDSIPLDLFFSYNELHDACMERRRRVAFGSDHIEILSAEDLAIFKALFSREKDWRDLRELLFAQGAEFDSDYTFGWLGRIVEDEDRRLHRVRALVAERSVP